MISLNLFEMKEKEVNPNFYLKLFDTLRSEGIIATEVYLT